MRFNRLYCNGSRSPLGVGRDILLQWNYGLGGQGEKQTAFRVLVSGGGDFDSGRIDSRDMRYLLSGAFVVKAGTGYSWRVVAYTDGGTVESPEQYFETAIDDLGASAWITSGKIEISSPMFERRFIVDKQLKSARAYVTGLGLIDCSCNGCPCSDRFFSPPNTIYDKIDYFETFDITGLIRGGENVFQVQLGNGYNIDFSKFGYRYESSKGLRCAIVLSYTDGTAHRINSGEDWLWRPSALIENGIYRGEKYDAGNIEAAFRPAVADENAAPKGMLLPDEMPPIRAVSEHSAVKSWLSGGVTVFDFGTNLQGIVRINVEAAPGTEIAIKHCEMIRPDGTPDFETNRRAASEDVYICRGLGKESYTPKFTYHGFRYAVVSGLSHTSSFEITALMLSSDAESESGFICSEAMINRIHGLCVHSMRCNFMSIPTDCPVRDERTPCQMDSQMIEAAAMYNFNMYSYYRKWFRDIVSAPCGNGEENPDWHGDYIMLAYRLYRFYGDIQPLREFYPRMLMDVANWLERSENGVWKKGFGDWCLPNDNTWEQIGGCKAAVNTSLLFAYCVILEEAAEMFNKPDDTSLCRTWKEKIRAGFLAEFVREDGTVGSGRQPEYILPLFFGLFDGASIGEDLKAKVKAAFCRKLASDRHLDTGGFGTMALIDAAAASGGLDLIPEILRAGDYPGFGFWMATGATSLWEQWAVKGVMHSHSHGMFSGIDASFYRVFCGVSQSAPGFAEFRVEPHIPRELRFCRCAIQTVSGEIRVNIERLYDGLEISLTVPPNTTAELVIPDFETYEGCGLWEGERRIEKKRVWKLDGGVYNLRLVPEKYVNGLY